MVFPILDLPPELAGAICEQLNDATLMSVRYVSRAMRSYARVPFGTRFFGHVVAILHPLSLTVLLEIARNQEVSKFVQKVTISGERVGGLICFRDQEAQKKLIDSQVSMERSGMDLLILSEVFRNLKSLTSVRVDNSSFWVEPVGDFEVHQCGFRHFFTPDTRKDKDSEDKFFNRAFSIVMEALTSTAKHENIQLDFVFRLNERHLSPPGFIDLDSTHWRDTLSPKVKYLSFEKGNNLEWSKSFLRTCVNLEKLVMFGQEEIFDFSHPLTGPFFWPKLRVLDLFMVAVFPNDLVIMLSMHKMTLTSLNLDNIIVEQGTWQRPLQAIANMPKLHELRMNDLRERNAPLTGDDIFDQYDDRKEGAGLWFTLIGQDQIASFVETALSDFRTMNLRKQYDDSGPLYEVDFRKAGAAFGFGRHDRIREWNAGFS